jgi:carbon storage regulator
MLVLSRKKNESIVINNDITVTVVEIRGDKVRLGIVAPKEVPVHRQEVYDAIHGKDVTEPVTAPATAPVSGPAPTVSAPVPSPVVVNSKPTEAPNRPV